MLRQGGWNDLAKRKLNERLHGSARGRFATPHYRFDLLHCVSIAGKTRDYIIQIAGGSDLTYQCLFIFAESGCLQRCLHGIDLWICHGQSTALRSEFPQMSVNASVKIVFGAAWRYNSHSDANQSYPYRV